MSVHRGKKILKVFVMVVGMTFLVGGATMLLWNLLMPALFGLSVITLWQALGLCLLGRLVTGGLPGRGPRFRGGHWRQHWKHKMSQMSEEDREKFREAFRKKGWGRHCGKGPFGESPEKSGTGQQAEGEEQTQEF